MSANSQIGNVPRLQPVETLMTVGQVAARLQVSSAWVRDHATRKQPRLPAVKLGKLLRFRPADVERFVETCLEAPEARRLAA